MAYFQKSPETVLQRDLDAARTSRDAIAKRLGAAQDKVTECEATLQRLAGEGAQDPALVTAERALDDAERRVSTLQPALGQAEKLVTLLESQLGEALDRKARAATASECSALADDYESVAKSFATAVTELAGISERATKHCIDASGLVSFAGLAKEQVPTAITMIVAMLRAHGVGLLAAPIISPPQNELVFCMKPVKWRDASGRQCSARRFTDADLPRALSARALSSGACCALDDPRRKQNFGAAAVGSPDLKSCVDLDRGADKRERAAESGQFEPIQHSAFTVVDRGDPFQMKVAR
jgi:hypothetical protein